MQFARISQPAATVPHPRWVHVDINSYFATLLQQENPALRGRPVGVVKDAGRTCLIAVSKEAKKRGVRAPSSVKEAKQIVPDLITVPAHFDMYLSATTKLKGLFDSLAPDVDIFSLDEAFINLTNCQILYPDSWVFAHQVQQQIKHTLGEWVTCNVGISHNRLLAKLTSEVSPKGSITQVTPDTKDALLASVKFGDVCGVGFRLEARLKKLGVTNPFQINFIPDEDLEKEFGPFWSVQLRKIGQGEEPHFFTHVRTRPHMDSIGRSLTCHKIWKDEVTIRSTLYNLIDEVVYKTRKMGLAGRYVSVSLHGRDEIYRHKHVTLPYYIRHTSEMFHIIYRQLYPALNRDFPVIKCSVRLGMLKPWSEVPQVLWPEWHQREKVYQAIDKITAKYGLFTVKSGVMANADIIRPEVTGFLGDKEYQLGRLS